MPLTLVLGPANSAKAGEVLGAFGAARRRGAIIRPLGDVVVLMPPLSIGEPELRRLVETTAEAIAEATTPRARRRQAAVA